MNTPVRIINAVEDDGFTTIPHPYHADFYDKVGHNVLTTSDVSATKQEMIVIESVHDTLFADQFLKVGTGVMGSVLVRPGQLVIFATDSDGCDITLVGGVSHVTGTNHDGIRETEMKISVYAPLVGEFSGVLDLSLFNEIGKGDIQMSAMYSIWYYQLFDSDVETFSIGNGMRKYLGSGINAYIVKHEANSDNLYAGDRCVIHVMDAYAQVYDYSELCGKRVLRYVGNIPFLTKESSLLSEEDRTKVADNELISTLSSVGIDELSKFANQMAKNSKLPFGSKAVYIESDGEKKVLYGTEAHPFLNS